MKTIVTIGVALFLAARIAATAFGGEILVGGMVGWVPGAAILPYFDELGTTFSYDDGLEFSRYGSRADNTGISAGFFAEIAPNRWLALRPELLYTRLAFGWETYDHVGHLGLGALHVTQNVELAILGELRLWILRLFAGPYFLVPLAGTVTGHINDDGDIQSGDTKGFGDFQGPQIGMVYGFGIGVNVGQYRVLLDLRYSGTDYQKPAGGYINDEALDGKLFASRANYLTFGVARRL
jgi:hypothetical protein